MTSGVAAARNSGHAGRMAAGKRDPHADAPAGRLGIRDLLLGQRALFLAKLVLEVEIGSSVGVSYVVSHRC
jgi:hypothetical protein